MTGKTNGRTELTLALIVAACLAVALGPAGRACAQDNGGAASADTVKRLEESIRKLNDEVRALKARSDEGDKRQSDQGTLLEQIRKDVEEAGQSKWLDPTSPMSKFTLGGYGEMHANFGEGKTPDMFDIHRLVLYLGYDFTDWVSLHSETEIEHAYVTSSSGGEVVIEQLYVDFNICPAVNVRAGRVLTPLGIINQKHEPTTFNGVERPSFAKYIIPSTWSSDGVGVFGSPASWLKYQAYIVGGLDGSMFTAKDGIRKGRQKERPGLNEPAVTGRIDITPLAGRDVPHNQKLRLGVSTYFGGLDNGNKGVNPGVDGKIHIYSADAEYSIGQFDFRGAVAHETIDGARAMGAGVAEQIFGFYGEAACHVMPEAWKVGRMKDADLVLFARYDEFDTQHVMPTGVAKDPTGDRGEYTLGASFFINKNLVVKADWQCRNDATGKPMDSLINLGLGWAY